MADQGQTQPLPGFLRMMVSSIGRHVLTGLAGTLVTMGVFQANQVTEFEDIGGSVLLFVAGLVWSAMQKKAVVAAVVSTNGSS